MLVTPDNCFFGKSLLLKFRLFTTTKNSTNMSNMNQGIEDATTVVECYDSNDSLANCGQSRCAVVLFGKFVLFVVSEMPWRGISAPETSANYCFSASIQQRRLTSEAFQLMAISFEAYEPMLSMYDSSG